MSRKNVEVQIRREGVAVESVSRPLHDGSVCVGGRWVEVKHDGETPFVELGPMPVYERRRPTNEDVEYHRLMSQMMAMAALVGVRGL